MGRLGKEMDTVGGCMYVIIDAVVAVNTHRAG